jgi:hypothetical protein
MQSTGTRYNNNNENTSSSSSRVVQIPLSNLPVRTSSIEHFSESTGKHQQSRGKHVKSSSQSISFHPYDRAQSNNQPSMETAVSSSRSVAPGHTANTSIGALGGCASTPSATSKPCSSNDRVDALARGRTSTITQALETRPLQMSAVPSHLIALQQQQSPSHPHPQHQQISQASHFYPPFPVPQHPMSRQRTASTLDMSQVGVDDSKCCLGFFDCDVEGNFIVPAGMTS